VQTRLALRHETDEQMLTRLLKAACDELRNRVPAIQEGAAYLRKNPGCMNYAIYDTYSTPSRDRRVFDDLLILRRAYREVLQTSRNSIWNTSIQQQLHKIFPLIESSAAQEASRMPAQSVTSTSSCLIDYMPGRRMDMAEFKRRLFLGWISNNPHDESEYRWGDLRGPSQRAHSCQSWDPWSPDLSRE
ncbi:MAG: hypothetical protein AAGB31_09135, partial [Bdellovibrio sp.]